MTQRLAVELGPSGIRVNCLRAHLIADAPSNGSYTGEQIRRRAAPAGISVEQWLGRWQEDVTLLGRLPTLAQVADAAVFVASDRAGAITGSVVDLTCGNALRTSARGRWLAPTSPSRGRTGGQPGRGRRATGPDLVVKLGAEVPMGKTLAR